MVSWTRPLKLEIFHSSECKRCEGLKPRLAEAKAEFGDAVEFEMFDLADSSTWPKVQELGITRIPTIRAMGDEFFVGVPDAEDFRRMVRYLIQFQNSECVVLTAPHAACPVLNDKHLCDTAVVELSRMIEAKLKEAHRSVKRLVGDLARSVCDLNRWDCRETVFRQELARVMGAAKVALLLDVHSFPPEEPNWGGYDVVLLTVANCDQELMRQMKDELVQAGYKTGIMQGSDFNDIVTSYGQQTRAVLIEGNERLNGDWNDVATAVCRVIVGIVSETQTV